MFAEILSKIVFFQGLKPKEIDDITKYFEVVNFKKGHTIFSEGDAGESLFIIIEGTVEITLELESDSKEKAELREFSSGDYFGEMALIDDGPRSASAVAVTDAKMFCLNKNDFQLICVKYPNILSNLVKTMSFRLRTTNEQVADVFSKLLHKNRLAALGATAGKIVHDMKNPIASIVLNADFILQKYPETQKYIDRIIGQTEFMNCFVQEILEYARGKMIHLQIDKVHLDDFFETIKNNLLYMTERTNIKIDVANSINKSVSFDVMRMNRTITNIVKNGIEAIGINGNIEITAVENDGFALIKIADDGPGISEEIIDKIFDPFVTQEKPEGTGLGLAIARKIIKDHGGDLIGYNTDKGAVFEITIPMNL